MDENKQPPELRADATRLRHLVSEPSEKAKLFNPFYSRFIRWMRLCLPLVALAITAIVFTWNNNDRRNPGAPQDQRPQMTLGKNELLNPRFENTDEKNRPYTLTAKRAVQDQNDEKLVLLEKPVGDLQLDNGHWVAIEAKEGAFEQTQRKLLLRGDVLLFHDGGYQLKTSELHIDIATNQAMSDKDVHGQGPEGTLEAKGLQGDNDAGTLVFTGPAKLVLNTQGGNGGGLFQ